MSLITDIYGHFPLCLLPIHGLESLILVFHLFSTLISYYYFKNLKHSQIVQNYFKTFNSFLEHLSPFLSKFHSVNENNCF